LTVYERDVQDRSGRWFALRVRPYKDLENRIDGAVLTLFDIDSARAQVSPAPSWRPCASPWWYSTLGSG